MRPRTINTFKILAVAAAAAGCTRAVGPEVGAEVQVPAPETATPSQAAAQQTAAPAQMAIPPETAERPIPPLPPGPQGAALFSLAGELDAAGPEKALQQIPHFRPLCDKDGYPLVGNVMGKGNWGQPYGPAEFCAEVRKKAKP